MPEDIRLKFGFPTHPKRLMLAARLGAEGVLALIDLWLFAGVNHRDGLLGKEPDPLYIAAAAGWTGDPHAFWGALVDLRWVVETDGGQWGLNDWPEHQPFIFTFEDRSEAGRKAANKRWKKRGNAEPIGSPIGLPIGKRNAPTHLPTVPDQTKPTNPLSDNLTEPVPWDLWISGFWKVVEDFWPKPLMGNPRTAFESLVANRDMWALVKAEGLDWLVTIFRNMDASWKADDWPLHKYPIVANVFRSQSEHWMRHTPEAKAVTVKASAAKSGLCTIDGCDEYRHGETDLCTDHFLEADR